MYRLTHAPLPEWNEIAAVAKDSIGVFKKEGVVADSMLAQPWLHAGERGFWFSRSAWSLYAIARFRMQVTGRESTRVWLPGYFCNASLAPLRELNVKLTFYPLSSDGKPDLTVCCSMLKNEQPDLLVVVHYFGELTPIAELTDFVIDSGAWLIEDATHVLRPDNGIGEYGDFVLYSPHKLLPIPDGALLLIRENSTGNITDTLLEQFSFQELYESIVDTSEPRTRPAYSWLAKRLIQKLGIRPSCSISKPFRDDGFTVDVKQIHHPKMSPLAKKLLFAVLDSLDKEATVRKKNQGEWIKGLQKSGIIGQGITPLSGGEAPYLAGFNCNNTEDAEKFYSCLNKSKLPVTTWPDLPPEVLADTAKHKVAIVFRETRFFLPVHRSIDSALIPSAIREIITEGDHLIVQCERS